MYLRHRGVAGFDPIILYQFELYTSKSINNE